MNCFLGVWGPAILQHCTSLTLNPRKPFKPNQTFRGCYVWLHCIALVGSAQKLLLLVELGLSGLVPRQNLKGQQLIAIFCERKHVGKHCLVNFSALLTKLICSSSSHLREADSRVVEWQLRLRGPVTGGRVVRQCTTGRPTATIHPAAAPTIGQTQTLLSLDRCGTPRIDLARAGMG